MEAAAIPGVAIPLLQDDCKDTAVDIDWVWNVVHLTSDDRTRRLDLDALRTEVETWFTPAALDAVLGPADGEADRVARAWLAAEGKRWRPFLTACAYKALQDDPAQPLPESLRQAAVAVECFHKASLVHDDIEDADERRYGRDTLHVEHGVPVALNAGDLLVGEGYRLLAGCGAAGDVCAELVRIAAAGHRELCIGQGAELAWMQQPAAAHRRSGARHLPAQDVAGLPGGAGHRRGAGGRVRGDAAGAPGLQRGAGHRLSDSRRPRGPVGHRSRAAASASARRRCCWRWPATRRKRQAATA